MKPLLFFDTKEICFIIIAYYSGHPVYKAYKFKTIVDDFERTFIIVTKSLFVGPKMLETLQLKLDKYYRFIDLTDAHTEEALWIIYNHILNNRFNDDIYESSQILTQKRRVITNEILKRDDSL